MEERVSILKLSFNRKFSWRLRICGRKLALLHNAQSRLYKLGISNLAFDLFHSPLSLRQKKATQREKSLRDGTNHLQLTHYVLHIYVLVWQQPFSKDFLPPKQIASRCPYWRLPVFCSTQIKKDIANKSNAVSKQTWPKLDQDPFCTDVVGFADLSNYYLLKLIHIKDILSTDEDNVIN